MKSQVQNRIYTIQTQSHSKGNICILMPVQVVCFNGNINTQKWMIWTQYLTQQFVVTGLCGSITDIT